MHVKKKEEEKKNTESRATQADCQDSYVLEKLPVCWTEMISLDSPRGCRQPIPLRDVYTDVSKPHIDLTMTQTGL